MAKKEEAKTESTASALAPVTSGQSEALLAQLEADGFVMESDGLSEIAPSDFRTAMKLFNLKGRVAADGTKVKQDMFFDSVSKTARSELRFVLLEIHKSNLFAVYDQREESNRRVCSSFDRTTGTLDETGQTRACKGCPDARWTRREDGKNRSNCSEVWDAFAWDLDEKIVFVIRFKKTSLEPIRSYLAAHHIGKRKPVNGRPGNIPLFMYEVNAKLVMSEKETHAIPVLTKGPEFAIAELKILAETAAAVRSTLAERLADAESRSEDTSFDVDAMEANANAAFVPEAG